MRRVTDVTKEIPVSRQVSCSIFSSRLEMERQQVRLPGKWYSACRLIQTTWFLSHKTNSRRITILPGIRPKELGSTPGSMKQRQGNYRIDRRRENGINGIKEFKGNRMKGNPEKEIMNKKKENQQQRMK